jgi:hypothetical protein
LLATSSVALLSAPALAPRPAEGAVVRDDLPWTPGAADQLPVNALGLAGTTS